ncbi:pyridoxal-phosphate dependent enzyme [Microbispora triticiradicis]|uniref:pyridoxal-phosphate dependent enzyme n=1 Tax=Microbispora triticiradicis TaxID=2200763 RepID=UPI001AD61176|nr:pyridoxal-phosphate dependent enzyme [Microbispora triticiradicis]MBO4271852.1 pyridoxal-phosphate dependent enzyme [Microbispora triticiradicis]
MDALFTLTRPDENGPVVLWGGLCESGSLKYLTYERCLATVPGDVRGFVEISGSSTALALDLIGRRKGLPTVAVADASGRDHLMRRGFRGEVRTITSIEEGRELCLQYERTGWYWPRQFTNASLVAYVERWGARLLREVRASWPGIRHLVCGFGTGATVAGLHRVFAPAGYSVVGLQAGENEPVPGWRNYALQNLGDQDLFRRYQEEIPIATAAGAENPGERALGSLLRHADAHPNPQQVLVISHDGRPPPSGPGSV